MANVIIVLILVAAVGYGIYSFIHHLRHGGGTCTARSLAIDDLLWDGPCSSAAKIRRTLVQSAAEYGIIHLYILE